MSDFEIEQITGEATDTVAAAEATGDDVAAVPSSSQVGRFELRRRIGAGGFGEVYEARDPELKRIVAVKIPSFGPHDKRRRRRFSTEARSAAKLHHPNIVTVFENGKSEDGRLYIASEFVAGRTLRAILKAEEQPTLQQKVKWVRDLANALHYAHTEGVIHRDIKPENILVARNTNRAKIADFGLAKVQDEEIADHDAPLKTQDGVLGTPAFMSPEQARGKISEIGPNTDQYSLGAVLYQCLTGKPPFRGSTYIVIAAVGGEEEPPSIRELNPSIPRDLAAICEKAMSKEADRRYVHVAAFEEDLERWLRGETVAARPVSPIVKLSRWCRRNPSVAVLAAALATVILVSTPVLWVLYRQAARALDKAQVETQRAKLANSQLQEERDRLEKTTTLLEETAAEALRNKDLAEENARIATANAEDAKEKKEDAEKAKDELEKTVAKLKEQVQRTNVAESGQEVERKSRVLQEARSDYNRGQQLITSEPVRGLLWFIRALERIEAEAEQTNDMTAFSQMVRANIAPQILRMSTLGQTFSIPDPEGAVLDVTFSPDGRYLARVGGQKLEVFDAGSGQLVRSTNLPDVPSTVSLSRDGRYPHQYGSPYCNEICFTPNGNAVVVFSGRHEVSRETFQQGREPSPQTFVYPTGNYWTAGAGVHVIPLDDRKKPWSMPFQFDEPKVWQGGRCGVNGTLFARISRSYTGDLTTRLTFWNFNSNSPAQVAQPFGTIEPVVAVRHLRRHGMILAAAGSSLRHGSWNNASLPGSSNFDAIAFNADIEDLRVSPDESYFAAILENGTVQLLQPDNRIIISLSHGQHRITDATFSRDNKLLMTSCEDRLCRVWECSTGLQYGLPLLHPRNVTAIAEVNRNMITFCRDGKLRHWQLPTGTRTDAFAVKSPQFAMVMPDGRSILFLDGEKQSLRLFAWETGRELANHHLSESERLPTTLSPVDTELWSRRIEYAPASHQLFLANVRSFDVLDAGTLETKTDNLRLNQTIGRADRIIDFSVSANGRVILYCLNNGDAFIKNLDSDAPMKLKVTGVTSVAISPDGGTASLANRKGEIVFVNALSGRLEVVKSVVDNSIPSLRFSPDGSLLAAAAPSSGLLLYDGKTLEHRFTCDHPQTDVIRRILFIRDGKEVCTVTDTAFRRWAINGGAQTLYRVRSNSSASATVNPTGEYLIEGSSRTSSLATVNLTVEELRRDIERRSGRRLTEDDLLRADE